MKIAIVADTHFGVRNESKAFLDQTTRFFRGFFEYLIANEIDQVIHLGDLVDRRKYVNYNVAKAVREEFINPLLELNVQLDIIAGNHDVYYNNTLRVNALRELLPSHSLVRIYDEPGEVEFNGIRWLMLPWMCQDNYEQSIRAVEKSRAQYCAAHLELKGFEMYRGTVADHGDDATKFAKFNRVLTGHYHTQSMKDNIHYVGAPFEMVWSDYDDPRGFWVFDTDNHQFSFVQNDDRMFYKVHVDAPEFPFEAGNYRDKVVKLIVPNNVDPTKFDRLLHELEGEMPTDIQVVDDHLNMNLLDEIEIQAEVGDTMSLLSECVSALGDDVDKDELTKLLGELYKEAQTTGV